MRWSWKLGEVAGIGIYVHWTFLILIGWIAMADLAAGEPAGEAIKGIGFVLALFGCIVLHELGHALTAKRFGVRTQDITLLPIGGLARLERIPENPVQEFWIAVAGPAVNVAIAGILAALLFVAGRTFGRWESIPTHGDFFVQLMYVNVALVVFNMIPAFPMDGGRVLRAVLAHFSGDYVAATQTAASIGQALAIMFGFLGLLFGNLMLMFIALFVFVVAQEEAHSVQMRAALKGVPVRHAMMTRVRALKPDDTLETAVQELLAGAQQDFPVVVDGAVAGLLLRGDVMRALAEGGAEQRVGNVMQQECATVEDTEMLASTFQRMRESNCGSLPVVRSGQFVGMITLENVGELLMVDSALRERRGRSPAESVPQAK
ncbi:MAG TPA: site-2 protease family protein [Pirellulales bacterium]|nr:site-2 protease family protein [Pirellulales bacterium]